MSVKFCDYLDGHMEGPCEEISFINLDGKNYCYKHWNKIAPPEIPKNLNDYSTLCHKANQKWWQNIETGEPLKRNKGELLALIHSEISEALEGERKNLMDDKLPQYKMAPVELVDAMIRIFDYLAGFHPDCNVQEIFEAKMAFNATRIDHTHEARKIAGGKQF